MKGLRTCRLPNEERDGIDAVVLAAYDRSLDSLATLGADIVEICLPARFGELGAVNGRIMSAEAYAALSHLVDDNAQQLDQDVPLRARAGVAEGVVHCRVEGDDALLTLTAVAPAIPVAAIDQNSTPAMLTRWVNFPDLCAVAVPNGFTAGGFPISLQIVCRAYAEPLALRIGYAYQTAHDWHLRAPPMIE